MDPRGNLGETVGRGRIEVVARGPFAVGSVVWRDGQGRLVCTVVAKATYALVPGVSAPIDDPLPIQEEDGHWDDEPEKSVHVPSDLAPFKTAPEIVVTGSAFAPGERPASSVVARVIVGSVDKSVEAFAPRFLRDGVIEEGPRPRRFSLRYEHAAGGPDTDNPIGIDISRADGRGRRPVPQLAPLAFDLSPTTTHVPTTGLGPLSAAWRPRSGSATARDLAWIRDPLREPLPPGFPTNFYQSAPMDQWLIRPLAANERIVLENLHQQHPRLVMTLSGLEPQAVVISSRPEPVRLRGDLLVLDSDRALCTLTFRGHVPIEEGASGPRILVVAVPMGTELSANAIAAIADAVDEDEIDAETTHDIGPGFSDTLPFSKRNALISAPPFIPAAPASRVAAPPPAPNVRPPPPPATRPMHESHVEGALPFAQPSPKPPPVPPRQPSYPDAGSSYTTIAPSAPPPPAPVPPALVPPAAAPPSRPVTLPGRAAWDAMSAAPPLSTTPPEPKPPKEPAPEKLAIKPLVPALRARDPQAAVARSSSDSSGNGNIASAASASDAAAREERAKATRDLAPREGLARPAAPEPLRRRVAVDLVLFDPKIVPRLRGQKRLAPLWAQPPKSRTPQSADEPQRAPADPERLDVLRALSFVPPVGPAEIRAALTESLDELVDLDPPLLLVSGELTPTFDEMELLRATVAVAQSVAGTDKRMLSSIAVAQEALSAAHPPAPETVRNLAKQIEQASTTLALPPRFLASQVERTLVENRKYKRRPILGAPRVRADLATSGGEIFPLYVPDASAGSLPLLPSFPVVAFCEVRPREDLVETQGESLLCVALGRVLAAR